MKIWITGASSGMGEACAYLYASRGESLVLTSPTEEELAPVAKNCLEKGAAAVKILPYDLQNSEGINSLADMAWDAFDGLDILFCNAGISHRTTVEDTSMELFRKVMEIDFFAPAAIAKHILPKMIGRGGGHIAATSSIAGKFGFPLRCAYSSAKHAVYGFFETLQAENHDKGIKVTVVCPGRVRTNISLNSLVDVNKAYGKMDPGQAGGLEVTKAAERIVKAIDKGKREVLVGRKELLMVYIKRFFPGLCAVMSRKLKPV
ncbi:MAG: SDR family NAD(P)-dependent oxidoreductase [Bacteroidales bacterium]|nr:SDR family NAD(P)-dependent oxidoreductase [Bacteroidales bacterium]